MHYITYKERWDVYQKFTHPFDHYLDLYSPVKMCFHEYPSIIIKVFVTYLNLGTTFQITEKRASGEMAPFWPCHRAINVFRSSSNRNLITQNLQLASFPWLHLILMILYKVVSFKWCTDGFWKLWFPSNLYNTCQDLASTKLRDLAF